MSKFKVGDVVVSDKCNIKKAKILRTGLNSGFEDCYLIEIIESHSMEGTLEYIARSLDESYILSKESMAALAFDDTVERVLNE